MLELEGDLVGVGAVFGGGGDDALADEDLAEACGMEWGVEWSGGGGREGRKRE